MIRKGYIEFLKAIVDSMTIKDENDFCNKVSTLKQIFSMIKDGHGEEGFWEILQEEYKENPKDLEKLLGWLYQLTGENWMACWQFETVQKRLWSENGNYYTILQLEVERQFLEFRLNRRRKTSDAWELNQYFRSGMQKLLDMKYSKIPLGERNKNLIVMAATQFGGVNNAPTKFILEFCYLIQHYLKKNVLLLCAVEQIDTELLFGMGLHGLFEKRYLESRNGWFEGEYRGELIKGYQILISENTKNEQKELVQTIYDLKPLCVWQLGGIPAFAGAMQQFTSFFYTWMTQGYPAVPADCIINYFAGSEKYFPIEREFLNEQGVSAVDIPFIFPYPVSRGRLSREQLRLPKDRFCLGVAGNRLKEECTDKFLTVMRHVLEREKDIVIVFIGALEPAVCNKIKKAVNGEGRCYFLGFQEELQEAIAVLDLYVDLPHQGGGTVGIYAMNEGKPLLCLSGSDVSAFAGECFCYEMLEQYVEEIIRYKNDEVYYCRQSDRAKERVQTLIADDTKLSLLLEMAIDQGIKKSKDLSDNTAIEKKSK